MNAGMGRTQKARMGATMQNIATPTSTPRMCSTRLLEVRVVVLVVLAVAPTVVGVAVVEIHDRALDRRVDGVHDGVTAAPHLRPVAVGRDADHVAGVHPDEEQRALAEAAGVVER